MAEEKFNFFIQAEQLAHIIASFLCKSLTARFIIILGFFTFQNLVRRCRKHHYRHCTSSAFSTQYTKGKDDYKVDL